MQDRHSSPFFDKSGAINTRLAKLGLIEDDYWGEKEEKSRLISAQSN